MTTIGLANTIISYRYNKRKEEKRKKILLVMTALRIYRLNGFLIHHTTVLATVNMLYLTSPALT